MDSLSQFLHYAHAFGIFIPILFLDKVLSFLVLVFFMILLCSLPFSFASVALAASAGYFIPWLMAQWKETILWNLQPALSALLCIPPDWHTQIEANSVVMVYICMPHDSPGCASDYQYVLNGFYHKFVRLYFDTHNRWLAKYNVQIVVSETVATFQPLSKSRDPVTTVALDDDSYNWTHSFVEKDLKYPPIHQLFTCSFTQSQPISVEDWKSGPQKLPVSIRLRRKRLSVVPVFESSRPLAIKLLTVTKMVVDDLYASYLEDIHKLKGETVTVTVVPSSSTVVDEQQLHQRKQQQFVDGISAGSAPVLLT